MAVFTGKRMRENVKLKPATSLAPSEAIAALRKFKAPKFDQTVNIALFLNMDPAQTEQGIRGSVSLPAGIGKKMRVIAFVREDMVALCLAAGALKAGGDDLVAEVEKGFMDFDVAVATPDMMKVVSKLGKVLGPKGLMPSPKTGAVTPRIVDAVKEFAAGKVEYRNDKGGNVHAVLGKLSFKDGDLVSNLDAFVAHIEKQRPPATKGSFIRKVAIAAAMSPSVVVKYVSASEVKTS